MSSNFASDHIIEPGQIFLIPTFGGLTQEHYVLTLSQDKDGDWVCLALEGGFVETLYYWYFTPRRKLT
jgi:hypothetical protein